MTGVAASDLAAGRGTTELAQLTFEGNKRPRFAADAHVALPTDDDSIAALTEHRPSVVAIDAPLSLPAFVARFRCPLSLPAFVAHGRCPRPSSRPFGAPLRRPRTPARTRAPPNATQAGRIWVSDHCRYPSWAV